MIKTIKNTTKEIYNWTKDKAIRFKKWLVILIFGAVVVAAPLLVPPDTSFENLERVEKIGEKYKITYNADPTEEMEVEIGGDEADFMPTAKLKKWGDETFIKVKHKTVKKIKPKQEDKKLKWKDKDKEIHFYTIDNDKFEFEIILKKKPKTNIVELDIETKGLAFYYQPELTQEEIDEGAIRPENVIGSYAVYHESKAGDYSKMGLKNYRAGKAFHIYRPKIIDNAGKEVWGKLNITDNLLTVTIPQEFLDNAVYPVRHAAGLTFGNTNAGASPWDMAGSYENISGSFYTSPSDIAGKNIDNLIFSVSQNGGEYIKGLIYSGGSGNNLSLVSNAIGTPVAATASQAWKTSPFSTSPSLSNSTSYMLGMIVDADNITFWYDSAGVGCEDGYNNGSYASPSTTIPSGNYYNENSLKFSIYATYTAGGAAERRMFLTQ